MIRTTLAHPTPELPVEDVERAQAHYRDALGFEIGWLYPGGEIGAVSRDEIAIFFRRRSRPFEPAVHWIFAADIDATYEELRSRGAQESSHRSWKTSTEPVLFSPRLTAGCWLESGGHSTAEGSP